MDRLKLPRRTAVIGTAGAGKTTLASRLAQRLGIPHVELDALYWGPNWAPVSLDLFRERVSRALSGNAWTADGNYSRVRDIVWGRADTVVWLDYSLPLVLGRATRRTLKRVLTREELWDGNREQFSGAFVGRDSIIWWALRTYRRKKREFPVQFCRPEYAHLHVVRLKSPRATRKWLDGLPRGERQITMAADR